MKILLLGEFSGLHNNLKDGLLKLGHDVTLVSNGDGWKNLPRDINLLPNHFYGKLGYVEYLFKELYFSKKLKNFDIVQFISDYLLFEKKFKLDQVCYNNLINNNKKSFFIAAGADPNIWQFWLDRQDGKMSNLIESTNRTDLSPALAQNLLDPKEKEKTLSLIKKSNGLIPIAYEYAEPYRKLKNLCTTIPLPINTDKIKYTENKINSKLVIFHGINRKGAKGTQYIEQAFEILRKKYPHDLELIITERMEYTKYIEFIKHVNVIIDQTNSYSLGLNGLISLAQGKVTMGGAELEGQNELGYDKEVCPIINIKPDPLDIVTKIEFLLGIKDKIPEIGEESRLFIEKYHNYIAIASKYLKTWELN